MNYILILLFLIVNQNDATDDNSQKTKNIHDSFNINIGAGYAIGSDQYSNSNPPNGSSNISFPKSYYPNSPKSTTIPNTTARGPRILTNFSPQIGNPFLEQTRNHIKSQRDVSGSLHQDYYSAAPSYNIPNFLTPTNEHSIEPNLADFQEILENLKTTKSYSKVRQVIKVPAIYEIHLQSDNDNNISENRINVNLTGDVFWKNYYENKPNVSIKYSDEYSKWLESNNMQRQESFTKDGEKYYDFSNTPVVTYENYPQLKPYEGKFEEHKPYYEKSEEHKPYFEKLEEHKPVEETPEENDILQPIINHHYNNFRHNRNTFRSDDEAKVNYSLSSPNKPTWQTKDHHYSKKTYNFNKPIVFRNGYSVYEPKPTSKHFHNEIFNFPSKGLRSTSPFKHNQAITEDNKPQALHEVPPPLLGKHPNTKYYEIHKVSQTVTHPKVLPTPATYNENTNVKLNKSPTPATKSVKYKMTNSLLETKPPYSSVKKGRIIKPETVPSADHFSSYIKSNQNLIYGTKSERVLTPYEINIPVAPGSTMVTVAESDNAAQNSNRHFHYSSKTKSNSNFVSLEKPQISQSNYYHKYVADTPQQSSKEVKNLQYKSNTDSFQPQIGYNKNIPNLHQKSMNDVQKNAVQNFQYPINGNKINSITSENPEISTNKYYQEVVDLPYQTQKSISDIVSTTQSSDSSLLSSITLTSTTNKYDSSDHSLVQAENKNNSDKNEDKGISGPTPTFRSKEDSRRRTFNINYDTDLAGYTKNWFNSYMKKENSRLNQRKNNGADYIIQITRKAID